MLRVTYTGELGWELHVTADAMPTLFDRVVEAGDDHGLSLFGTYAMNSLRMEKAYRAWGAELGNDVDMYEAGMERFVHFDHTFVGRDALADSPRTNTTGGIGLHGGQCTRQRLPGRRAGFV